jgi:BolA family transcriptional regulator, general stress-responsive regulator
MTNELRVCDEISQRLRAAFPDAELRVEDESEEHRGHGGWREGGQTHFHIALRSAELAPLTRIARHRRVHEALGKDLVARIHALRLTLG